ncbi:MAG TPA: glycosyltransferase family 4 protein [Anaerolineae bacterium]|nr:glycosyltransferase family 4 protein [Anaerolineae bacterium]
MTLKIGMVTGEFPPMEGGVGAFTSELSAALHDLGHEVHVVTGREARPKSVQRDVWNPRDPHDVGYAHMHPRVNRWWWSANGVVVDVALRYELDIVNIQYQAAAYDMRIPAINLLPWRMRGLSPTVVTFHDLRHPYLFPKAGRLRRWVVHHLARSADGVLATNSEDFDRLLDWGVAAQKLRQIPIGSNVTANPSTISEIQAVRGELGLDSEGCLLGYFGFINPSKGPDLLIQALAGLDNGYHLAFIGGKVGSSDPTNTAYLVQIEELIRDLGLQDRVHWSGFLEEQALSAHMAACDIMVMPYRDGVSLRRGTLMAILAHGRPLITTRPEQSSSQLTHGHNIWLTEVDDPAALSDAIRTLVADDALREQLGRGAKKVSGQFTWDKIAAETVNFYHAVLGNENDNSEAAAVARQTGLSGP